MTDFDDFESELATIQQEHLDKLRAYNYLVHRVFKQSEDGQKLLDHWKELAIMTPTVIPEADNFTAGINEGKKTMIREICHIINQVEEGL